MKVEFDSDGVELIGRLFLPAHGGPAPGVVAGTWTSVKELMADHYARRLLGICATAMYMSDNAADDPAVKSLALVAPWLHDATICAQVYGGSEAVAATTRTPPSPTARGFHAGLAESEDIVWTEGTQFDFYDQEPHVTIAVDAVAAHFQRTL
ncbi:hypothetical protein [Nocardia cyriacigeorgica]|uniref:hypothetical protein n=1 Tax=Nocardia cyriacigeorgica TaxID=135487 RepID=UPI001895C6AD|nr:hypothetical protein [Nocardia cyriacigeorgica]MBF6439947.1 hypothetical protein [Nocardia cyriacigeorgica]